MIGPFGRQGAGCYSQAALSSNDSKTLYLMPEALPGASEVGGIHEEWLESEGGPVGQHHGRQEVDIVLRRGPDRLQGAPPLHHAVLPLYHLVATSDLENYFAQHSFTVFGGLCTYPNFKRCTLKLEQHGLN